MSSVPPARSIRVGARASIRNSVASLSIRIATYPGIAAIERNARHSLLSMFGNREKLTKIRRAFPSRIADHNIGSQASR
jgi:hypothetical protein